MIALAPKVLIRWMMSCRRNTTSRGDGMFGCASWFAKSVTAILRVQYTSRADRRVSHNVFSNTSSPKRENCLAMYYMSQYQNIRPLHICKHCLAICTSFCRLIDKNNRRRSYSMPIESTSQRYGRSTSFHNPNFAARLTAYFKGRS